MLALCAAIVLAAGLISQRRAGATPISRLFRAGDFQRDARAIELERIVRDVRPGVFVVAPDAVLAHLAERPLFQRADAWTREADDVIVSITHRQRFNGTQTLWRTDEEIPVRNLLAHGKYGLFRAEPSYLLLRRGWSPRAFAEGRYVAFSSDAWSEPHHVDVDRSLAIASWRIEPRDARSSTVTLWMVARERWPHDMGLELGWGPLHRAGERDDPERICSFLAFDGLLNPAHVRVGEVARTSVTVPASRAELLQNGLYFGVRRVDGSRLNSASAHWVRLDVPTTR